MRNLFFISFLFLFVNLQAQTIGLRGNLNFYKNVYLVKKKSFTGGIFYEQKIYKDLGIIAEANYSEFQKQQLTFGGYCFGSEVFHTYKIISPSISVYYNVFENKKRNFSFKLFAGYYYSFNYKSQNETYHFSCTKSDTSIYKLNLSPNPNGVIIGSELSVSPFKNISLLAGIQENYMNLKNEVDSYNQKTNDVIIYLKCGFRFQ